MYLITQTKQGISSIELGRRLGTTQTTAWQIKTKLAEVMRTAGEDNKLDGRIEMDDAYLGGARSGGKTGRGSPGKKPIIVAVQTDDRGRPRRIKLRRIARFKRARIKSLTKRIITPGSTVVTDGYQCFHGVKDASCVHVRITTGSGPLSDCTGSRCRQNLRRALADSIQSAQTLPTLSGLDDLIANSVPNEIGRCAEFELIHDV